MKFEFTIYKVYKFRFIYNRALGTSDYQLLCICVNKDPTDWRALTPPDVLTYLCTDFMNGKPKMFCYKSSWTECLRLIRNVNQHWHDRPRPRPQPEAFYQVGDPQGYFLNLYPNLPIEVHRIVRSCDWKDRPDLKEFFV